MNRMEEYKDLLNELENQIYQEEKKYRINSLLLHMLYDKNDDIEAFKAEIKETGIFTVLRMIIPRLLHSLQKRVN